MAIGDVPGVYDDAAVAEAARGSSHPMRLWKQTHSYDDAVAFVNAFAASPQVVFTDGSCPQNPGAVAGVGVYWGPGDPRNVADCVRSCEPPYTNNIAELEAIERAAEILLARDSEGERRATVIVTDSSYAINCLGKWHAGFVRRNWEGVANAQLIRRVREKLNSVRPVVPTLVHVRGHHGIPGNEAADQLAATGATRCSAAASHVHLPHETTAAAE